MSWEYETSKQIRDHESDLSDYLKQRHRELTEPRLEIALYDTEKNEAARKGWIEQVCYITVYLSITRLTYSAFLANTGEKIILSLQSGKNLRRYIGILVRIGLVKMRF